MLILTREIKAIIAQYDLRKGLKRKLLGDHPIVTQFKQFVESLPDDDDHALTIEQCIAFYNLIRINIFSPGGIPCIIGLKTNSASYKLVETCCELLGRDLFDFFEFLKLHDFLIPIYANPAMGANAPEYITVMHFLFQITVWPYAHRENGGPLFRKDFYQQIIDCFNTLKKLHLFSSEFINPIFDRYQYEYNLDSRGIISDPNSDIEVDLAFLPEGITRFECDLRVLKFVLQLPALTVLHEKNLSLLNSNNLSAVMALLNVGDDASREAQIRQLEERYLRNVKRHPFYFNNYVNKLMHLIHSLRLMSRLRKTPIREIAQSANVDLLFSACIEGYKLTPRSVQFCLEQHHSANDSDAVRNLIREFNAYELKINTAIVKQGFQAPSVLGSKFCLFQKLDCYVTAKILSYTANPDCDSLQNASNVAYRLLKN